MNYLIIPIPLVPSWPNFMHSFLAIPPIYARKTYQSKNDYKTHTHTHTDHIKNKLWFNKLFLYILGRWEFSWQNPPKNSIDPLRILMNAEASEIMLKKTSCSHRIQMFFHFPLLLSLSLSLLYSLSQLLDLST